MAKKEANSINAWTYLNMGGLTIRKDVYLLGGRVLRNYLENLYSDMYLKHSLSQDGIMNLAAGLQILLTPFT